eukprot:15307295-Alexandrium_andersonii.AAC.1
MEFRVVDWDALECTGHDAQSQLWPRQRRGQRTRLAEQHQARAGSGQLGATTACSAAAAATVRGAVAVGSSSACLGACAKKLFACALRARDGRLQRPVPLEAQLAQLKDLEAIFGGAVNDDGEKKCASGRRSAGGAGGAGPGRRSRRRTVDFVDSARTSSQAKPPSASEGASEVARWGNC